MNKFVIVLGLTLFAGQASAGLCTDDMRKRGCYDEEYGCNRPTHYTCHACMCPTSANTSAELLDYFVDQSVEPSRLISTEVHRLNPCDGPHPPPFPRCR